MIPFLTSILLVPFSIWLLIRGRRCAHRPLSAAREEFVLRFHLQGGNGAEEETDIAQGVLSCGFTDADDIDFRPAAAAPKRGPRRGLFRLRAEGENLRVEAKTPILINGVRRSSGTLRPNQFVRAAGVKLLYRGLVGREERYERPRRFLEQLPCYLPGIALLLVFVLSQLIIPFPEPGKARIPVVSAPEETPPPLPPVPQGRTLRTVAPGEPLPDLRAEILFVHAHPDDESLDYGSLLAGSDAAGRSTAVLLLTDGEGGIFRSDYPGPAGSLEELRIAEAERAMEILGVDLYLRFGLENRPYNGTADERSSREVLREWEAEGDLSAALARAIERLQPTVIVSPDTPSEALEHFEHEAAGLAVEAALQRLREADGYLPRGHLLAVDPRQAELYPEKIAFSRGDFARRQQEALLAHATQADAAIFGVEMIAEHPYEYYHVAYWSLDEDPADYLLP